MSDGIKGLAQMILAADHGVGLPMPFMKVSELIPEQFIAVPRGILVDLARATVEVPTPAPPAPTTDIILRRALQEAAQMIVKLRRGRPDKLLSEDAGALVKYIEETLGHKI